MRLGICASALLAVSLALAQPNPSSASCSLKISAPMTTFAAGKAITIQVTLENTSQSEMTVVMTRARGRGELDYDVSVVTAKGGLVALSRYGRALAGQPTTPPIIIHRSPQAVTIRPNATITDAIDLTRIYRLNPGAYIVRVSTTTFSKSLPALASNSLEFTVAP